MKKQILWPFTLSTLVVALAGCGGESANVNPEPNQVNSVNGSCLLKDKNCVEFALDYPVDGINFVCSSDPDNTYMTLMEPKTNAATGRCSEGDKIHFLLTGSSDKQVELGTVPLSEIGNVSTVSASLPRLSILDMAKGLNGGMAATSLSPNDKTVKIAMALAKIFQALGLERGAGVVGDVQPFGILASKKADLSLLLASISAEDYASGAYVDKIRPWIDVSQVSNEDAFKVVQTLVLMNNSATYQADFPIFANALSDKTGIGLPQGLYGCNATDCKTSPANLRHLIGSFIILTDRQGYTFGSGVQWRGPLKEQLGSDLATSVTVDLLKNIEPAKMNALAQTSWINPLTKSIQQPFKFNLTDPNSDDFTITQGKLFNDYLIAGTEKFYKQLTKDPNASPSSYGLWQQNYGTDTFKGSFDAFKIFPIGYLDNDVFKSKSNVAAGQKYIFPLYANLIFKAKNSSDSVALGIAIDESGDIRTDMQSASNKTTACTPLLTTGATLTTDNNQVQYRIGTLGATDTSNKAVTFRILLANPIFDKIDGAVIGANTNIVSDVNSEGKQTSTVIGGARVNLGNLLSANVNESAYISLSDFSGAGVKWTNIYKAYLNNYYEKNSIANRAAADFREGEVSIEIAECYKVLAK